MSAKAEPEYVVFLAVLGVLAAIGLPALKRGEAVLGWTCIASAAMVVVWVGVTFWRSRN